jgi:DUF4097 and DUF4098 domain-containing protein YvlB
MATGEIEVETRDDTQETVVELLTSSGRDEVRRTIEAARIELRPRGEGNTVVVEVRKQGRLGGLLNGGEITMRITCPGDASVELSTATADVSLRGRYGGLRAQLASGDLRADELYGRVEVKAASSDVDIDVIGDDASITTASGDIDIRKLHGEATLRSASGDVTVDHAATSVTIQTASGDQRIGSVNTGRITTQSASGDQEIAIARGTLAHLDVRTMSGDASSDLDVRDALSGEHAPIVEIRATSMSGDIHIGRA